MTCQSHTSKFGPVRGGSRRYRGAHAAPPRSSPRAPRRRPGRQRDRQLVRARRALGLRELPLRRGPGATSRSSGSRGRCRRCCSARSRASRSTGSGPKRVLMVGRHARGRRRRCSFLLAGSFPVLIVLGALDGRHEAFSEPAFQALPPRLVADDQLVAANGVLGDGVAVGDRRSARSLAAVSIALIGRRGRVRHRTRSPTSSACSCCSRSASAARRRGRRGRRRSAARGPRRAPGRAAPARAAAAARHVRDAST